MDSCFSEAYEEFIYKRDFDHFLKQKKISYDKDTLDFHELEFFNELFYRTQNFSLKEDVSLKFWIKPENSSNNFEHVYEISTSKYLRNLNESVRKKHGFQTIDLYLNVASCFKSEYAFNLYSFMETILDTRVLFLMTIFNDFKLNPLFIKDCIRNSFEVWEIEEMKELVLMKSQINDIIFKFIILVRITIGLFIVFSVTAILTRFSIIFCPFFFSFFSRNGVLPRYRWFTLYFNALEKAHKSRIWLLFSQSMFWLFILFVFVLMLICSKFLLFTRQNPLFIRVFFYLMVFLTDIFCLFFLRTRTSLKYFPLISFFLIFGFLFYLNCNPYTFGTLALFLFISLIVFLMTCVTLWVEHPACSHWDIQNINTPKLRTPRILFNPCFNINWLQESPQLWTVFMPLFGRSFFDSRHLAFINNDIAALNCYENGNASGENDIFRFEESHLLSMPGFMEDDLSYRV